MLVLFVVITFFAGGIGYAVAMAKFDSRKPKLTARQVKAVIADFTDRAGTVDVEQAAQRIEWLLQPQNTFPRTEI